MDGWTRLVAGARQREAGVSASFKQQLSTHSAALPAAAPGELPEGGGQPLIGPATQATNPDTPGSSFPLASSTS